MTQHTSGEHMHGSPSPYHIEMMQGKDLGLPVADGVQVQAERWVETVTSLERAGEIYQGYGAVVLAPGTILDLVDYPDVSVQEFTSGATKYVIEELAEHPEAVRKKDYDAYNGTPRHLYTVSPENVEKALPEVTWLQSQLLPTVRAINGDPSTEISVDPDEGTVINLQLFDKEGDLDARQQHGAHTDRVDTTTIVCLDNVGPHGELVFVEGYNAICKELGLEPHRGFDHNIAAILEHNPDALTFRIHDVRPGTVVMVKSAEDVHFITAKTLGDVRHGLSDSVEPLMVKDKVVGRGIINMAFETSECREIDQKARALEAKFPLNKAKTNDERFAILADALKTVDKADERAAIANAIVTRFSATDLYQETE